MAGRSCWRSGNTPTFRWPALGKRGTRPAAWSRTGSILGRGRGAGVMEIVSDFDSDTFRAVYTITFREAVYVLHCFQKKSPRGKKTSRTDVNLIRERLKAARELHEQVNGKKAK
jgi:phage-related protein